MSLSRLATCQTSHVCQCASVCRQASGVVATASTAAHTATPTSTSARSTTASWLSSRSARAIRSSSDRRSTRSRAGPPVASGGASSVRDGRAGVGGGVGTLSKQFTSGVSTPTPPMDRTTKTVDAAAAAGAGVVCSELVPGARCR